MMKKECITKILLFVLVLFSISVKISFAEDYITFDDLAYYVSDIAWNGKSEEIINTDNNETVTPDIRAAVSLGILGIENFTDEKDETTEYFYRNPTKSGMSESSLLGYGGNTAYYGENGSYAEWKITVPQSGYYKIYFYNVISDDNCENTNVSISSTAVNTVSYVNQKGSYSDSAFVQVNRGKTQFSKNDVINIRVTANGRFTTDCIKLVHSKNPPAYVTNYQFTKAVIDAFEIRTGTIYAPALGQFFTDYTTLSANEREYVNKAVMLGITNNSGAFLKDSYITSTLADTYIARVNEAIEVLSENGLSDFAFFKSNEKFTNTLENGRKVTFYHTLNTLPQYSNASVILILYNDGKLVSVSEKKYTQLNENGFTVMHSSVEIPPNDGEYTVKALVLNGINELMPLYEYKLLK